MGILLFVIVALNAGLAILPASIARDKGKDFGSWYLYALFFWPVAIFHAISLPEPEQIRKRAVSGYEPAYVPQTRYEHLRKISLKGKVDLFCPIDILSYEILEHRQNYYLRLSLFNSTAKHVSALQFMGTVHDSFGNLITIDGSETIQLLAQDMGNNTKRQFSCEPILLPNGQIREVRLEITQIRYSDGEIVVVDQHKIVEPEVQQFWTAGEKAAAQSLIYNAVCYPVEQADFWVCACGRANLPQMETCIACETIKDEVFAKITREQVQEIMDRNQKAKELQEQYLKQ